MSGKAKVDEINSLARLIGNGAPQSSMCRHLNCNVRALQARIRRNSEYIISRLPPPKHTALKLLIEKGRTNNHISMTIDLPDTLINCARDFLSAGEYPEAYTPKPFVNFNQLGTERKKA